MGENRDFWHCMNLFFTLLFDLFKKIMYTFSNEIILIFGAFYLNKAVGCWQIFFIVLKHKK